MTKLALFITARTRPGRRDELRRLWERHLKPRAEANESQEVYFFCGDGEDPDTLYISELYNDVDLYRQAGRAAWFADYTAQAAPLLAGPPQVAATTPVWAKGASL